MKLLTHNMMQSHVKGITKRFPLLIKPADDGVRIVEQVKFVCVRVSTRLGDGDKSEISLYNLDLVIVVNDLFRNSTQISSEE